MSTGRREDNDTTAAPTVAEPSLEQLDLPIDVPPATVPDTLDPRRWLEHAARTWSEVHDRQMTVRWARDLAIIKPLLRLHGSDELAARWRAYIATEDPFLARRGWDVPTFSTCIDRYAGDIDRAMSIGLRNLRPIRDPLTGAILGHRRGW